MTFGCSKPTMLHPYRPYLVGQNPTARDRGVLGQLSFMSRDLTKLSLSLGGDNTVALADMTAKLRDYNIGLMGASTSVYANRIGGFAGAVRDYQDALMRYRHSIKGAPAAKSMAKQKAHAAFRKLQTSFGQELDTVTARSRFFARKGTPLTSATRATNIARSSRSAARLNVTGQIQASNLVKFSEHAKVLGNGLVVIDFASRVGNIHTSYKAGDNWERDLFIESSSFAASALTGIGVVNAGLAFLMVVTPVGWVGLIVGGVAVAGVAAAASMGMNDYLKKTGGGTYDRIMKWLGSL